MDTKLLIDKAREAYIKYVDSVVLLAEQGGTSFYEAEEIVTEKKIFRAVFAQDWNTGSPAGPKVFTSMHLSTGDREAYIRANQSRIGLYAGRKWHLCIGPKVYAMVAAGDKGELFDADDVEDGME